MRNKLSSLGVEGPDGTLSRERSVVRSTGQSADGTTGGDRTKDITTENAGESGVEKTTVVTGKRGSDASQSSERAFTVREEVLGKSNVEETTIAPVSNTDVQEADHQLDDFDMTHSGDPGPREG